MNDVKKSEVGKHGQKREPLIHITKRVGVPIWKSIMIRAIAIGAALVVCGVLTMLFTGDNPLSIYASFFVGAFGDPQKIWFTMQNLVILLGIALAVTPAFKMKFWNTGAEGQVLAGGLATAMCMFWLGGKIPDWVLIIVMLTAGVAAGMLWGILPAVFKAKWNTNETLFTLMMNYVAIQLIEWFLKIADKTGSNTVGPTVLKYGWIPDLFGQKYLFNIIVVAALTVFIYIYLKYSKHGYEISVVGESEKTARYIGINVPKVIIRTMALSGAICGLMGFLLVGVTSHSISADTAGGRGFTAIMVSWLAQFNPIFMVLTSLLIVFLGRGAEEVSTKFDLNQSFSDIITGIILFFIIGCEFFIRYKVNFRGHHEKKENN